MESNVHESCLADLPLWAKEQAKAILMEVGKRHSVEIDVLAELVALQRERQHQERAHGVNARIGEILDRISEI